MVGRIITRLGPAMALIAVASASSATAGGMGHGGVIRPSGGFPGGAASFHGLPGGAAPRWSGRSLPPISGVIHERPGMRSYVSGYGHTNTAARFGGLGGAGAYGHTATALPMVGAGRARFGGYGHTGTALVGPRWGGRFGGDGRRFAARFGRGRYAYAAGGFGGYGVGGYGGYGVGADGYGGYGGTVGVQGGYGSGSYGTTATEAAPGASGGPYASETPLAARFAEAPLAPSPGSAYSPNDAYAYAASADAGPGPRIIAVGRGAGDCRCGYGVRHVEPVVYRYGVGTAY